MARKRWSSGGTYAKGDVVSHRGRSWRATAASSNVEPGTDWGMSMVVWIVTDGDLSVPRARDPHGPYGRPSESSH